MKKLLSVLIIIFSFSVVSWAQNTGAAYENALTTTTDDCVEFGANTGNLFPLLDAGFKCGTALVFGSTTQTLSSTAPTSGQYLEWNGTNIVGASGLPCSALPALTGAVTTSAGSCATSFESSPSFTTPNIGAATATSLLASGIVDGQAPVTITTTATATLGSTYNSGYTFNQEATASTAITYTLPVAAAGKQYCVGNSYNGSAGDTGTIEVITSGSGQYIDFNGAESTSNGYVISGGALGDKGCAVGISSTQWEWYAQVGTWTLD